MKGATVAPIRPAPVAQPTPVALARVRIKTCLAAEKDDRFDVCCYFFERLLSSAKIASIIAMKGPSFGFTGGFHRQ